VRRTTNTVDGAQRERAGIDGLPWRVDAIPGRNARATAIEHEPDRNREGEGLDQQRLVRTAVLILAMLILTVQAIAA
jgi:hypothetical protein